MDIKKIVFWVGLAVAIIGAFVSIPYAAPILLVGGLVYGLWIEADTHVRVIVSALALKYFTENFAALPGIGATLGAIVGNLAALTAGAAVMIVLRNMLKRAMP